MVLQLHPAAEVGRAGAAVCRAGRGPGRVHWGPSPGAAAKTFGSCSHLSPDRWGLGTEFGFSCFLLLFFFPNSKSHPYPITHPRCRGPGGGALSLSLACLPAHEEPSTATAQGHMACDSRNQGSEPRRLCQGQSSITCFDLPRVGPAPGGPAPGASARVWQ